ncbi:MAG: hypothetical protein ACKOAD_03885, partial [Gammaproteobacteria bacterium]
ADNKPIRNHWKTLQAIKNEICGTESLNSSATASIWCIDIYKRMYTGGPSYNYSCCAKLTHSGGRMSQVYCGAGFAGTADVNDLSTDNRVLAWCAALKEATYPYPGPGSWVSCP